MVQKTLWPSSVLKLRSDLYSRIPTPMFWQNLGESYFIVKPIKKGITEAVNIILFDPSYNETLKTNGTKYSKVDQVKFVEDNL